MTAVPRPDLRYERFPEGFFQRADESPDPVFYEPDRFVTHIDDAAIAAVGALYDELGIGARGDGRVLDLCSSWISHFTAPPPDLVALGMNQAELAANESAAAAVVHDLNVDPTLPFEDASFDDAVCCVSVDYLTRPLEVFDEVARVLRPGGRFVCTFSNRCFPTKAIRGWLETDDATHVRIVATYFALCDGFDDATGGPQTPADHRGDPVYAVWASRR